MKTNAKVRKWRVKLEFDFADNHIGYSHASLTTLLNDVLVEEKLRSIEEFKRSDITKLSLQLVLDYPLDKE